VNAAAKEREEVVCPRCSSRVAAQRFDTGAGRTRLWRCECGWSRVVAESGVVNRDVVKQLAEDAAERDDE